MLNGLLIAANSFISVCYFIIALLIFLPFLRGQQKTSLVLATILVFFSCGLGHGGHVLLMASGAHITSPFLLRFQVVVDLITATIAVTYIALQRYYSFLIDGPLLLTQAKDQLAQVNAELASVNANLESQILERTAELSKEIAERKQAELQLQRSNALLKAQQEAAIDGILVVDENNRVLSYNQRFHQIWNIPESLVEQRDSRKILELVVTRPENKEEFISKINYLYQHLEIASHDEVLLKDGRTIERYTTGIESASGDYYGRMWYFRDISDRKQAEAQLKQQAQQLQKALDELKQTQTQLIQSEKMSSLGQLVAGIAHEINNPVSFIYGNIIHATEYVEELMYLLRCYEQEYPHQTPVLQTAIAEIDYDYLTTDLPQLLSSIKTGAERIREIVLTLRNFSRLDEAEIKAVNIHEGIDSALLILRNRLTDIEIIKYYHDLPLVECYPGQLNQVFMNILSNAIDALESCHGQSKITISTKKLNPDWVAISIQDNGSGMDQSTQQKIFDPFFTTKPVGQGTGLGLSISYQIVVDKHQGLLKCNSSLSEGTEFWIEIPTKM